AASAMAVGDGAQVTTNTDNGSVTGCELRDAIASVTNNTAQGGCTLTDPSGTDDKVTFAPGMSGQTITLNGNQIVINDPEDLDISGPGMNQLTISGNDASRVLSIQTRTGISGLSLVHGNAPVVATAAQGGGIQDAAAVPNGLVLTDVKVANSKAEESTNSALTAFADGGAIHSLGPVTLNQSVITGNHATATQTGTTATSSAEA